MADEAIIDIRIVEKDVVDAKGRISEAEDAISGIEDRTHALEFWRNGNGAKGAEVRLQEVEDGLLFYSRERIPQRLSCVEADMEVVRRIADAKLDGIQTRVASTLTNTLDKRDRTAIAKIRAWGPYFAAGVVLILGILERVLK